jgi:hypothetical protein
MKKEEKGKHRYLWTKVIEVIVLAVATNCSSNLMIIEVQLK